MKKLLFILLFLAVTCNHAFALLTTENVDKDKFGYMVTYQFATANMAASRTDDEMPTSGTSSPNMQNYYVVPRDGTIAGISVASNLTITSGSATFDVTINENKSGLEAVIAASPALSAIESVGNSGSRYSYINQDRSEDVVKRGFSSSLQRTNYYDAEHPYGKATALTAGDRIGIKVSTSSGYANTTADFTATVFVLD
jgi:hypothetical protein